MVNRVNIGATGVELNKFTADPNKNCADVGAGDTAGIGIDVDVAKLGANG